MNGKSLGILAFMAGCAALGLGLLLRGDPAVGAPPVGAPRAAPAWEPELERLRDELAHRDRAIEELRLRLEELELRLARRAVAVQTPPAPAAEDEPAEVDPLAADSSQEIGALQRLALDPARSARDRVVAVGRLWRVDRESGLDGSRTPEIVDAMLGLLAIEPSAALRARACFHVLGATEPRHAPLLIDVLERDLAPEVRAQAADTLQHHPLDAGVRLALERASTDDDSELVRSTATEMLARFDQADGE